MSQWHLMQNQTNNSRWSRHRNTPLLIYLLGNKSCQNVWVQVVKTPNNYKAPPKGGLANSSKQPWKLLKLRTIHSPIPFVKERNRRANSGRQPQSRSIFKNSNMEAEKIRIFVRIWKWNPQRCARHRRLAAELLIDYAFLSRLTTRGEKTIFLTAFLCIFRGYRLLQWAFEVLYFCQCYFNFNSRIFCLYGYLAIRSNFSLIGFMKEEKFGHSNNYYSL